MAGPGGILVVADCPEGVALLNQALMRSFPGVPVSLAASILEFRSRLDAPDTLALAVIDLGLPDRRGLEVMDAVRRRWPDARVLVCTLSDDDSDVMEALARGAGGYLLKSDLPDRLSQALQLIMAGEPPLSAGVAGRMLRLFHEHDCLPYGHPVAGTSGNAFLRFLRASAVPGHTDARLGVLDLAVLKLAVQGQTLPEIAARLGKARHTVATCVRHLYAVLAAILRAPASGAPPDGAAPIASSPWSGNVPPCDSQVKP